MKTLSHLQNEAIERIKEQIGQEVIQDQNVREIMPGLELLIRAELETIVKESFKNTRVEEITSTPQGRDERDAYNEALKNIKDTQNHFLNN